MLQAIDLLLFVTATVGVAVAVAVGFVASDAAAMAMATKCKYPLNFNSIDGRGGREGGQHTRPTTVDCRLLLASAASC